MLKRFKEDGRAVLIATSSFWAGVDVPGSALSLLIIDKLPFETPTDPIFNARCMYFDADNNNKQNKKSSFMSIAVPEAIIELRQGLADLSVMRMTEEVSSSVIQELYLQDILACSKNHFQI